jgi:hypothetical protein
LVVLDRSDSPGEIASAIQISPSLGFRVPVIAHNRDALYADTGSPFPPIRRNSRRPRHLWAELAERMVDEGWTVARAGERTELDDARSARGSYIGLLGG